MTELAPWPSLVQRFGRCARWGGEGQVIVIDLGFDNDKQAAPYSVDALRAAREACHALPDVGPIHLERYEDDHRELLPRLYPYEPAHLLLRHELDELFDTTSDLSGADIDISRFIRSGDERDVQVFWAEVDRDGPPATLKPTRDQLCSVPFLKARDWLCQSKSESLKPRVLAWVWDWLSHEWRKATRRDIYPGQTVLVKAETGGYRRDSGWDPASREWVEPLQLEEQHLYKNVECWATAADGSGWCTSTKRTRVFAPEDQADDAEDDESLSVHAGWQTIASHGLQVGEAAKRIAAAVAPAKARLLHLAGRWHDLGKAHPAFQGCINADDRPARKDIAKAPDPAWPCSTRNMYCITAADQRRGFRHELASTLGLFAVLQRHQPQHQALLGPWRELLVAMKESAGCGNGLVNDVELNNPAVIEQEILDLDADDFNLLAYLVCAHHGKVRMAWHASSADQKAEIKQLRIRGVQEGDTLPPVHLADADGTFHTLPATALDLSPSAVGLSVRTGSSWTERVLNLVEHHGPFTLAWLETLLRAADQRASTAKSVDMLLAGEGSDDAEHPVDRSHRTLVQLASGGASSSRRGDSLPRRPFHGDGR